MSFKFEIVLLLGILIGCPPNSQQTIVPQDPEQCVAEAKQYISENRPQEAIKKTRTISPQ
jgi:hypothetical protein